MLTITAWQRATGRSVPLTEPLTRLEWYAADALDVAEQILAQATLILPLAYERDHLLFKPRVRRYPLSGIRTTFWKDVRLLP